MKENIITKYVKTSLEELTKVSWPTKNQAIKLTGIVLGFCLASTAFLTLVDYGFNELYTYLLTLHF
jgi:preprotein translocase SecE subunit